jgi:EAL domain-containing protein (putative c-di-GMP-specific phosphodiesterase class I)
MTPDGLSPEAPPSDAEARAGLARGEFTLLYQPIAETAPPHRTVGFEALARWIHPTRGALEPDAFMPDFAEDVALRFGEAVLEGALLQMRRWRDAGVDFGRVAVNLSPAQFRDAGLASAVLARLAEHGVDPTALCVEITETVDVSQPAVAAAVEILSAAGVEIALDDFGTGYATLAHLEAFPIHRLKIDRSFCRAAGDLPLVRTVARAAQNLGMRVVAEGVEDPAQLATLCEAGCDLAQGWLIGRPAPAAEAEKWMAEGRCNPDQGEALTAPGRFAPGACREG